MSGWIEWSDWVQFMEEKEGQKWTWSHLECCSGFRPVAIPLYYCSLNSICYKNCAFPCTMQKCLIGNKHIFRAQAVILLFSFFLLNSMSQSVSQCSGSYKSPDPIEYNFQTCRLAIGGYKPRQKISSVCWHGGIRSCTLLPSEDEWGWWRTFLVI